MYTHTKFISGFILILIASTAWSLEMKSTPQRATLIELYTSQGCSSCPPAEEYLNKLLDNKGLWKPYIPLAFHVDYWDYLGWKDRFASPAHRVRQEKHAKINRQSTIYTPGFYVNGKPWRPGFFNSNPDQDGTRAGILSVNVNGGKVKAEFTGAQAIQPTQLHIAVLGLGLESRIGAGENRGRHSRHEFVVLHHQVSAMQNGKWQFTLSGFDHHAADRFALAAWVSQKGNPIPIQAVGGFASPQDVLAE